MAEAIGIFPFASARMHVHNQNSHIEWWLRQPNIIMYSIVYSESDDDCVWLCMKNECSTASIDSIKCETWQSCIWLCQSIGAFQVLTGANNTKKRAIPSGRRDRNHIKRVYSKFSNCIESISWLCSQTRRKTDCPQLQYGVINEISKLCTMQSREASSSLLNISFTRKSLFSFELEISH